MAVNNRQIGGEHYKTAYEHWDFVTKVGMGYLDGNTTKYVARWRKKEGVKDLQKAMHYLDKLIEVGIYGTPRMDITIDIEISRFAEANGLTPLECQYMFILCTYHNERDLKLARNVLAKIMNTAFSEENLNRPGTPDDGGHHAKA